MYKVENLKKMLRKGGSEYLIAQIGMHAYEIMESKMVSSDDEIILPVEVKQPLSAGEKQLFSLLMRKLLEIIKIQ